MMHIIVSGELLALNAASPRLRRGLAEERRKKERRVLVRVASVPPKRQLCQMVIFSFFLNFFTFCFF
jgi:hypothetical protein